jgi:ribonuclease VapC
MIIDASALLAMGLNEPEAERMRRAIAAASVRLMSPVNWLEAMVVMENRFGPQSVSDLREIAAALQIELLSFDAEQANEAHLAARRYGKGRHAARLNLGDCCAYAAAVVTGEPLLFKGGDFTQTDIACVNW